MGDRPLVSQEVFQLSQVEGGLRPGTVSFKTVTMESDKYVCVRDVQPDGQTSLVVVDLENRQSTRHDIKTAEAAIMNPSSKILALRVGGNLQIFSLDAKARIKSCTINDAIAFWKWIDDSTVAVVTTTAVFHWSCADATSEPVQMFSRAAELDAQVQILNYKVDAARKWLMLTAVARTPEGVLVGKTQIHSVENNGSRVLEGHAGAFVAMPASNTDPRPCNIMCLAWNAPAGGSLMIMELPTAAKPDITYQRKQVALAFAQPGDFPVAVHVSPLHRLLIIVSSRGQAFLIDVLTGEQIASETLTPHVVFCGTPNQKSGGLLCVNNQGSVFHVSINNSIIARYIYQQLQRPEMALRIASHAKLPGVDELFKAQLQNLLGQGAIDAAVALCLAAPPQVLRTPDTLQKFMNTAPPPGQGVPISTYFKAVLEAGKLTGAESVELARVVTAKGQTPFIVQQFNDDKLEVTEQLGDLIAQHDAETAMKMYHKINAHNKVVNVLLTRNESQKAVAYCKRMNYSPDWRLVLTNFVRVNPTDAVALALMLHNDMGPTPVVDPNEVVDMFLPGQNIKPVTEFLVSILHGHDTPETAKLQTRLLEINLKHSPPSVAEKIFAKAICTHFDALLIAQHCERAGLWQRAIECYQKAQSDSHNDVSQLVAVKRCLSAATDLNPQWLVEFFAKFRVSDSLEYLGELMKNVRQNFKVIVQIAAKYNEALGNDKLISMFLQTKSFDVLYYYLGAVVPYSRDAELHFRYIEAATEVGQISEVERMTRESPCYDPERTKTYLKEKNLEDPWPLINVCDKHDFVPELVKFLVDMKRTEFVQQFVQRRNPAQTPFVIGALLDTDSSEDFIKSVLTAAGAMCPVGPLVEEVERRGRLRMLQPWLEARAAERSIDPALYNALGKNYVDLQQHAAEFLERNEFYEPAVLGKYCENRDPNLSVIAYTRGKLYRELIELTTKQGMWKEQAKFLVKQQNPDLWVGVLRIDGRERGLLVTAVQQILGQCSADEASVTVRAFVTAELTHELTELLDQIVVHGQFRKHRILENLLLMSAIRARKDKVLEYINVLEDYDAKDIATIASGAELHEAAFTVYNKAKLRNEAIGVLLNDLRDLPRGRSYAAASDDPAVWTTLAQALLKEDEVHEAIEALIRAKNPGFVAEVCAAAERANQFGDLIKYLTMARAESKTKDPRVDTYLVLTYAKTGRLADLEEFLKTSHGVQIMTVADKCYADGLYDSARVLYLAASNFPRLASTYVKLANLTGAVDAAQKAQNIKTWKEVNLACLESGELKLAALCAAAIVVHAEEVLEIVALYESAGLWEEMVAVFKGAISSQGAHMGLFTELGVLYAKYKPEKLLEHVKVYPKKINTHRMLTVCDNLHHWLVVRVLHINNEDWLASATCMIQHPADAWEHEVFKEVLGKLGASDMLYNAITFYVMNHPEQLHDLLMTVMKKVDTERVMREVTKNAPLALIRPFLEATQERNMRRVNDALNTFYVEEEDFAALRRSVEMFDNFDSAELSAKLEKLELFEFRKIALALHRKNKRHFHAIEVSKTNKLYQEAMEAAAESGDREIVLNLLRWFVSEGLRDCFAACLYACYDFVTPHEVMELAWLNGMTDAIMPFLIQVMMEYTEKVNRLESAVKDAQKAAKEAQPMPGAGPHPLMIEGAALRPGGAPAAYGGGPNGNGNGSGW